MLVEIFVVVLVVVVTVVGVLVYRNNQKKADVIIKTIQDKFEELREELRKK